MKIVLPGGTGLLGRILTRAFRKEGHQVVVLSRNVEAPAVPWDGRTLGRWAEQLDGADAVINLAGRSVDCRYDAKHRAEILASRVESTRIVGEAIARAAHPPRVWLQSSTSTIYSHRYDAPNDEHTGVIASDEGDTLAEWRFSIEVAQAWEGTMDQAVTPQTRKVKLRTSMVMSPERGSAFALLRRHVSLGFGRLGDGKQYMSWIHERDFVRAVEWLIEHDEIDGVVNLTAPHPIPNDEFMRVLGDACGAHCGIPSTGWVLELGAFVMRTEPELVLKSRRVIPARLLEHGFAFEFNDWDKAARELCTRARGEGTVW
jgi:uncharacterized protein (TIGR01777 family)